MAYSLSHPTIVEALGAWAAGQGPLYRRLASALRGAVQRGDVRPGDALPAERALASALAVSRSTVVAAYDELRGEGLLESRQGSGTWVRGRAVSAWTPQEPRDEAPAPRGSFFRALLDGRGDAIPFVHGCPRGLPMVADVAAEVARAAMARTVAEISFTPFGLPELRRGIAGRYERAGVPTAPEQILVTSGAQQAIALVAALLARRGEAAILESVTYPGAIDAFATQGAHLVPVALDGDGARTETLESLARSTAPRAAYLIPTFQNPTGTVMPVERRREAARVAEELGLPIVEDEALADVTLGAAVPPPIAAYARPGAPVFTIGSLSKLFWGGLRVGWVRAPEPIIRRLARLHTAIDLGSSVPSQLIAVALLDRVEEAQRLRRDELVPRRELLERALGERLPAWSHVPAGNLSLWAEIPRGDAAEFAQVALRHGVEIVPGATMAIDGSASRKVRLPFVLDPEEIAAGVERLARAWEAYAPGAPAERGARLEIVV